MGATYIVAGVTLDELERTAFIITLRYGAGFSIAQIIAETGVPKTNVHRALRKYRPKQSTRDMVLIVESRLNWDDTIEEPLLLNEYSLH